MCLLFLKHIKKILSTLQGLTKLVLYIINKDKAGCYIHILCEQDSNYSVRVLYLIYSLIIVLKWEFCGLYLLQADKKAYKL